MGATIAALIVGFTLVGLVVLAIRVTNNMPSLWSGEAQDIPHLSRLDIYVADEMPARDLSEQDTQELDRMDGTATLVRVQMPRRDECPLPTVGILDPLAYVQPCDYALTSPLVVNAAFGQRAPVRVRLVPYCPACHARDGRPAPANGLPRLCISHQTTMILPVLPLNGGKPAAQHDERKRA